MKKIFIIILVIFSINAFSQNNGIGVRMGDPTGVTYKKYMGNNALEINIGYTYLFENGNNWYSDRYDVWYKKQKFNYTGYEYLGYSNVSFPLCLQIHYLFQKPISAADSKVGKLSWYWGLGGQLRLQSYSFDYAYKDASGPDWNYVYGKRVTDLNIGVDGVGGVEYKFSKAPFSVFCDFTLELEIYDNFAPWGQAGIGGRYNF